MMPLEIIHLRMAGATPPGLVEDIKWAIDIGGTDPATHIYRHASLAGDLSIHLRFRFGNRERSAIGAHLARALEEHGLVEHTVWLEQ
jgi:hypothetical protein